ncbi:MAG: addiction module protein [Verrucomicrobiota bacterium]
MSGEAQAILEQALKLPAPERELLVELLHESTVHADPEIERAWIEECQRRSSAVDAGEMDTLAWEDVKKGLQAKYPQA